MNKKILFLTLLCIATRILAMEPEKNIAPFNWRSQCIPIKSAQPAMRTQHNYFEGWKLKIREDQQLREAAKNNNQQLLQDFINLGHDVNSQINAIEFTALHEAVEQGHKEATTILLQNGANPNLKECRGFTPLHMAVIKQNTHIMHLLIDHGAHALKDKQNHYPEDYTKWYYYGQTPPEGIDIKNDQFAIKSHPALLHAHLAAL